MRRWPVAAAFAAGILFAHVLNACVGEAVARSVPRASLTRSEFERAVDLVLGRFVDEVDASVVLARGLKQLVAGLDGHSSYLTAEERRQLDQRRRDGDVGFVAVLRNAAEGPARLEVARVVAEGPAARAGLQAGDEIVALAGRPAASFTSQGEVEAALAGRPGERLTLRVRSRVGGEPKTLSLQADRVDRRRGPRGALVPTTSGEVVAHLRIEAFRSGTGERVKHELRELRNRAGRRGLSGVILDVRGNPGGEVAEALVVADMFVRAGVLTRTRGRGGQILREERAHDLGTDLDTPLVVLQDRYSASAAELLAAALRENGRARVVGETSFGKGTVQEVIGLADGSVLTLTVARYFSPLDRAIDEVGVVPDVAVEIGSEVSTGAVDRGLAAAVAALEPGAASTGPPRG